MNVIHLPTSVGGNAWGLSRGERKQGLKSDVLCDREDWLDYPCDIRITGSKVSPYRYVKKVETFFALRECYDVFHFNYGKTLFDLFGIFDQMELPLLSTKKICVTYNGSDARQNVRINMKEEPQCSIYEKSRMRLHNNVIIDKIKAKRIEKFRKYNASFFSVNPDLMRYLPSDAVFLPYTISSWDRIRQIDPPSRRRGTIRVIHAPTNRIIKGTYAIIKAVNNINARRPKSIDLILVENVPNRKALIEYEKADVVIDQLRIGWYGGFAVEMMKMGKPVIAYINEEDLKYIPPKMGKDCMEALINADKYSIEKVLLRCIENPEEIEIKRQAQLEYVHKWHNPEAVALITKKKYEEM